MKNPIFLVSTGRTGTKFFSKFFATYGIDIASYHTSRFTRTVNVFGNIYRQKLLSRSMMKSLWRLIKFSSIQSHPSRYIECNPYYYNLIDIINDFFPEAKFVVVIRFPKSFIISHIRWERQRWKSIVANRLVPFWQPTSYIEQLKGFKKNYYQRVTFYSKIWARKNSAILKAIAGKDNAIVLRFEQIFHPTKGVGVMENLIQWLDVSLSKPITEEMINAKLNISKGNNVDSWDAHCTRIMNRYCGSLLKELGYD